MDWSKKTDQVQQTDQCPFVRSDAMHRLLLTCSLLFTVPLTLSATRLVSPPVFHACTLRGTLDPLVLTCTGVCEIPTEGECNKVVYGDITYCACGLGLIPWCSGSYESGLFGAGLTCYKNRCTENDPPDCKENPSPAADVPLCDCGY
jgi:hypothetical protein